MSLFKRLAVKGGSSKRKEPVIDVDDLSPKPKRTRFLIGVHDSHKFRSYATFYTYANYFKDASLLVERAVNQPSLLDTKSLYGLPPRIGISFSSTLMMHTRIW